MALEFFLAKNSSKSAKANGVSLHSSYNPQVEAERFAQSLSVDFVPKCAVIVEGALSYCAAYIKKRFPKAKVGTIRFTNDFFESDKEWDFCLPLEDKTSGVPLCDRLFDLLGEEGLFQTAFFDWKPSAAAWPEDAKSAWAQIKAAVQKSKAVLATREHFGKRWLKNKLSFFNKIQKPVFIERIKKPVLICASGPSLEGAVDAIKKVRSKIFVCALSSAISVLADKKIAPDLALSADGGWWAKKHLYPLKKFFADVPLALEPEAACPSALFRTKEILPLCYDDDYISQKIFEALGIKALPARRNGTVSGSALELFLSLCDSEIFFSGLDLSPSKDKSHALPNVLETERDAVDFRLKTKATRQAAGALPSESLAIYESWFKNFCLRGRKVYRIKGEKAFANSLGQIQDISAREFESLVANAAGTQENFCMQEETKGQRNRLLKKLFVEWSETDAFCKEIFPADSIMLERAAQEEDRERRKQSVRQKKDKLLEELFGGQE
ncbi:MAG: 6-hydroxymethylpterin diphosphokinase MptE-like protein [Treponema sp.]|nr:6-hydroxymethylpterin diphosphokinase MptE-like protein [Treponema sp.]MEE3435239.1 6-hydroxymethylpterin diphosphokinase MptE-like protein [Treponema sp.]